MPLLPTENEGEFLAFGRAIVADLNARGAVEMMLAERIVAAHWKIRRLRRYEAASAAVALHKAQGGVGGDAARLRSVVTEFETYHCGLKAVLGVGHLPRATESRRALLDAAWSAVRSFYQEKNREKIESVAGAVDAVIFDIRSVRSRAAMVTAGAAMHRTVRQALPFIPKDALAFFGALERRFLGAIDDTQRDAEKKDRAHALKQAVAALPPGSLDLRDGGGLRIDRLERRLLGELDAALRAFREHREWLGREKIDVSRLAGR